MGCSSSKLDDEEAVRLCKDRKKFIKQAVEYRARFATGHIAYIQALKRVAAALRDYIEGDFEPRDRELLNKSNSNRSPKCITISPKCFSAPPTIQSESKTCVKISYYRPEHSNTYVSVEERPPETVQVQSHNNSSSMLYNCYYEMDGFFTTQSPSYNSSNTASNPVPASPSLAAQWDFFWNPFSSLDYYGYSSSRSGLDQSLNVVHDDINGLRHVREAEGIPDLEEETDGHDEESDTIIRDQHVREENGMKSQHPSAFPRYLQEEVTDDDDDNNIDSVEDDDDTIDGSEIDEGTTECFEDECKDYEEGVEVEGIQMHGTGSRSAELPRAQESHLHDAAAVGKLESREEEAPGFTVYVNRRALSTEEVIRDLEARFVMVCESAEEVSSLLDARSAQYLSSSNEITTIKMLNPVALFRSGSFRSSSSRCLVPSRYSGVREEADLAHESSSSDLAVDTSMMVKGSHPSTLDRLYAWEKRLYGEVRDGERIRLAYEKKCKQLIKQNVKGEDPSSMDKTRATMSDLHTQIKVAIRSIEAISKRIEALRDEELEPQLLNLVHGLSRMWKVMAECHQTQKRTLDDAKIMLAGTPSRLLTRGTNSNSTTISSTASYYAPARDPNGLALWASNLEAAIRNWKSCFKTWVTSQRSYVHALTGWLLRCMRCAPDAASKSSSSPSDLHLSLPLSSPSRPPPSMFPICIEWSRLVNGLQEAPVLDGLEFFASGMGSICAPQMMKNSTVAGGGSKRCHGSSDIIEHRNGDDDDNAGITPDDNAGITPEKMAEVAVRVLRAGMSVAVTSLTEFAIESAQGYAELINATICPHQRSPLAPPAHQGSSPRHQPPLLQQLSRLRQAPPLQELTRPQLNAHRQQQSSSVRAPPLHKKPSPRPRPGPSPRRQLPPRATYGADGN